MNSIKIINLEKFKDSRGKYIESFNTTFYKKYSINTNFIQDDFSFSKKNVLRGFHGDSKTWKLFFCVKGKFEVKLVEIDDWENPSNNLNVKIYILEEENPKVLQIPEGYVNGFSALEENSKLMIMSNFRLGENPNDDVRFESNKW